MTDCELAVLIVEDEREQEQNTRRVLEAALGRNLRVEVARDIPALERIGHGPWSLVVLDKFLRKLDAIRWLEGDGAWLLARWKETNTPVFLTSTYAHPIEDRERLRRHGLLVENWGRSVSTAEVAADIARLCGRETIADDCRAEWQTEYAKAFGVGPGDIHVGPIWRASTPSIRVMEALERRARDTKPVLLLGETGTGKERAARFIHERGRRRADRFIAVNCASMPEPLLESELFGHVEGAFTHARNKIGRIELAEEGTLFLDEAEAMSPRLQAALLRVIEDKEVCKVGGDRSRRVDVRFIVASNRELDPKRGDKSFREDLYRRIEPEIRLPSWAERVEGERRLLAEHVLRETEKEANIAVGSVKVAKECKEWVLSKWDGAGNLRKLKTLMEEALRIDHTCLRLDLLASVGPGAAGASQAGTTGEAAPAESLAARIRERNATTGRKRKPSEWLREVGGDKPLVGEMMLGVYRADGIAGLMRLFTSSATNLRRVMKNWSGLRRRDASR